ncbi:hypothetical protein KSP39_PZI002611 [Platanthera zijinensis]|uniref:YTH domain-containing family protein n=1 Tax=Platanthera zijinensis TaxID=2320716 RepID=A0AAP0GE86_9ASPA
MASERQCVGHDPYFATHNYVEERVPSVSEAIPTCSKNSDIGFSRKLDFLHEPFSKTFATEFSASIPEKKSNPFKNLAKKKDAMDGAPVTDQYVSKPNQFSSSSKLLGVPFSHVNKFQSHQHGYGGFPFREARGYHGSTKTPSYSYHAQGKKSNGNDDTSTELVRGPRANRMHFPSSAEKNKMGVLLNRDQFNRSDFQIKYEHAKFFMIKSFSEDDVHKSIKYNVWASTPHGNNKLEAAFRDAEVRINENVPQCPIFLFFSVNSSGQFVGLAEMIGPIDFKKTMEFWHDDKWKGFFPVKWHIVKDIPNKYFQNIRLENNDNRPVTFSRDTQEIGLPQGLKMLQFFKSYPLARSLLDDFEFYEQKERSAIEQRRRQQQLSQTEVNTRELLQFFYIS